MSRYNNKRNANRQHLCDTESPQRACCWAARDAELAALPTEQPAPHPEHADAVARALRGED